MTEWLEQASQWHEMHCHDLEVMSSNPGWVKLRVLGTSVLSRTWTKNNNLAQPKEAGLWSHSKRNIYDRALYYIILLHMLLHYIILYAGITQMVECSTSSSIQREHKSECFLHIFTDDIDGVCVQFMGEYPTRILHANKKLCTQ